MLQSQKYNGLKKKSFQMEKWNRSKWIRTKQICQKECKKTDRNNKMSFIPVGVMATNVREAIYMAAKKWVRTLSRHLCCFLRRRKRGMRWRCMIWGGCVRTDWGVNQIQKRQSIGTGKHWGHSSLRSKRRKSGNSLICGIELEKCTQPVLVRKQIIKLLRSGLRKRLRRNTSMPSIPWAVCITVGRG